MSDEAAGAALFERYFEEVYSYVACRTVPDHAAAQDITQDVFLAAMQSVRPPPDEAILPWLRAIARNKVADHFRRRASRSAQTASPLPDEVANVLAAAPDLDPAQQRAVLVSVIMRGLPEHYSQILEEKYLEGFSVQQIAQRRGMSQKAVESTLTRAREAFRRGYQALQDLEPCEESNP
jgi:RNA polymerase sigma-70 factor (ECF subfamily)